MTVTAEVPDASPRGSWVLGLCMGLSNVLGYAFVVVLSRALGPAEFGALSAMNNVALLLSLPAGAFQIVIAARQARGHTHDSGLGLSMATGTALGLIVLMASPVLSTTFHLDSALPAALLALMLPAFTLTGACQGLLLGHRRFVALSAVYLAIALARVLAAVVAAVSVPTLEGVFACLVVAAWLPAGAALLLARRHVLRWRHLDLGMLCKVLTSNGALVVLLALTSTDVLLARHFLDPHEAGAYAFAALFGKVTFWGTQFIAFATIPVVGAAADGVDGGRGGAVSRAVGLVLLLGLSVTLVVALVAGPVVRVLGGADYVAAVDLLVPFTLVGTIWAMCQVLLFAEAARGGLALTMTTSVATTAAILVVWTLSPSSGEVVLGVFAAASAGVLLVATILVGAPAGLRRPSPR